MKNTFLSGFLFLTVTCFSQQSENAQRFHVVRQEMRTKENGTWSDWSSMNNFNASIDENITINNTKKTITLDYKVSEDQRKFYTYDILSIKEDTTYMAFDVYGLHMRVKQGNQNILNYVLLYSFYDNISHYTLISTSGQIQTKYILKELN